MYLEGNWYITYNFTLIKIAAVQEDGVIAQIPFSQKSLHLFMKLLRLQMNSWEAEQIHNSHDNLHKPQN